LIESKSKLDADSEAFVSDATDMAGSEVFVEGQSRTGQLVGTSLVLRSSYFEFLTS
jgi:hypothetical protein